MELDKLDHTGIRVDERGRVKDWTEFPPNQPRPLPLQDRRHRQEFTDEQNANLLEWCTAAQMQDLMGSAVFEQLAALDPDHTWPSYKNKWTKLSENPLEVHFPFDEPFPNLLTGDSSSHPVMLEPGRGDVGLPDAPSRSDDAAAAENSLISAILTEGGLAGATSRRGKAARREDSSLLGQDYAIGLAHTSEEEARVEESSEDQEEEEEGAGEEKNDQDGAGVGEVVQNSDDIDAPKGIKYSHMRVDIISNVYRELMVKGEEELIAWLKQDFFVSAYFEFATDCLEPQLAVDLAFLASVGSVPRSQEGKLPHDKKIDYTVDAVKSKSQRFIPAHVDKSGWSEDDHDIKFMSRIVCEAGVPGRCWAQAFPRETKKLCERAFYLMLWIRWLYKVSIGSSAGMKAARKLKARWLGRLRRLQEQYVLDNGRSANSPEQAQPTEPNLPPIQQVQNVKYSRSPSNAEDLAEAEVGAEPHLEEAVAEGQGTGESVKLPAHVVASTSRSASPELDQIDDTIERLRALHPEPSKLTTDLIQLMTFIRSSTKEEVSELARVIQSIQSASSDSHETIIHLLNLTQAEAPSELSNIVQLVRSASPTHEPQDTHSTTIPLSTSTPTPQDEHIGAAHPNQGITNTTPGESISTHHPHPKPYYMPQSRNHDQQKAVDWLKESTRNAFIERHKARLAQWGLTPEHEGTCLLVGAEWDTLDPVEIIDTFSIDDCPRSEDTEGRLDCGLFDHSVLYGRALAWFLGQWPRRGVDLDQFLCGMDGPWQQMHGSHRCHHGFCIIASHLLYEDKNLNIFRNTCKFGARKLRIYSKVFRPMIPNFHLPKHCVEHTPPCLLQHAALTSVEAILIQLAVLRQARGLPPAPPFTRPADFEPKFDTFEYQLPIQFGAPDIKVYPHHLARSARSYKQDEMQWCCAFCDNARRRWGKITGLWAHLKSHHLDSTSKEDRLRHVKRSAEEYLESIRSRRREAEYSRNNPQVWNKLLQAAASTFSWEVFSHWPLQEDRFFENMQASKDNEPLGDA